MERRIYLPGSEWLYIELYSTECLANLILTSIINYLRKKDECVLFFYVRYHVPSFHLRLRFNIPNFESGCRKQLMSFCQMMFEKRMFYDMKICTYKRELERYSLVPYKELERFFCYETELILNSFELCPSIKSWELSVWLINMYFDVLQLPVSFRVNMLSDTYASLAKEFRLDGDGQKLLNKKFRLNNSRMCEIIEKNILENDTNLLHIKEEFLQNTSDYFMGLLQQKDNEYFVKHISDLFHMANNRIFSDNNRKHEMVVYYWLNKYYKSYSARANHSRNY